MYCASMVTNFALMDSSFRLHKHPIGLQMEKLCHALVLSMAHYYYPKSVQEGRCFQQEVIQNLSKTQEDYCCFHTSSYS